MSIAILPLFAGATLAAIGDIRSRRVSNQLNLAILFAGLGWRATTLSPSAVGLGVLGALVGLAVLLAPFAVRWVGAGDVKLLAACGAFLGPFDALLAGLFGLFGGGVLAIAIAISGGAALRRSVAHNVKASVMTMSAPLAPRRSSALTVPLAVPIAAAAVAIFLARGY